MGSKPEDSAASGGSGGFLARLGAFLALVVAVDFWSIRHLGISLEQAAALGGIVGVVSTAFGWFGNALTKEETEAAEGAVGGARRLVRHLIAPRTLAFLYAAALLGGLSCSSVQLVAPNHAESLAVQLSPIGSTKTPRSLVLHAGTDLMTMQVVTTPFGRTYRLDVEGRLPYVVQIPPLVGATVSLDDDLRLAPTILLRVPPEASASLSDTNWVSIWKGAAKVDSAFLPGDAFHLGTEPRIRDQQIGEWRGDLILAGTEDARRTEHYLRAWKQSTPFPTGYQPMPGDSLRVEVCTDVGMRVAEARFVVTSDELVDVLLTYVSRATPCGT